MQYIILTLATIACASAAPGFLLAQEPDYYHLPLAKSTFTSSSQTVDHGSTHVIHPLPVVHTAPLVHVPMSISTQSHERTSYHAPAAKTTVTNSKQVVNHGSTAVYHAPVVSSVALHSSPLVYHSSPLVAYKTPDSAISHHSSTIHETVPVVNSLPLYALH
ncbi:hypothetical protein RR46_00708 [Papilio xuthus]|uniref:Cuticular protein n=1 Tax=Papilio xuthus TaxID=66420 RepID=A0A0N0PA17_PAPXU|nr:hypothetical protein RR46_00708 [Papilio xuthus]